MAHTPGPWIWRGKSGSLYQVGEDRLYGAVVLYPTYEYDSGIDSIVSQDDAHLIAAAPSLLDALTEVMEWISAWNPNFEHDDEWPASRDKARAAIASATGATK